LGADGMVTRDGATGGAGVGGSGCGLGTEAAFKGRGEDCGAGIDGMGGRGFARGEPLMDAGGGGMAIDALDPAPEPDPEPLPDPPGALPDGGSVGSLPELELPAVMGEPEEARAMGERCWTEVFELEPD